MKSLREQTICIIPARSGSKRIKNKNIISFFGKPIISYAIENALKSKLFDKVLVSTDSIKISKIANKNNALVNGLRHSKLSNNFSTVKDVLKYEIKKNNLQNYKYLCCIYPCAGPLLKSEMIREGFKILLKNKADQLITVSKYDYPPEKSLIKLNNKFIKLKNKNYFNSRTQDLNNHFKDTGSLYFYKIDNLIKKNLISKITFLEVQQYTLVDVDSPEDLDFLKLLYKKII